MDDDLIDRVALAINGAWNRFGDVPFPLYQHEAEELAKAAIDVMRGELPRSGRSTKSPPGRPSAPPRVAIAARINGEKK